MAQTTEVLDRIKKASSILPIPIKRGVVLFLDIYAQFLSRLNRFYFPKKFNWEWKLEMLMEKYERDSVHICKKLIKPKMVVMDIGAHIGYYTRIFSKLVGQEGRVYAFEPNIENFELLKKNTHHLRNVTLCNKAVSDKIGSIDFFILPGSTGSHSIFASVEAKKTATESTTIDHFLRQVGMPAVNFLKIDIEGGEPLAFRGMLEFLQKQKDISVIMEFLPGVLEKTGEDPQLFLEKLRGFGLMINVIAENGEIKSLDKLSEGKLYKTGYYNLLLQKL